MRTRAARIALLAFALLALAAPAGAAPTQTSLLGMLVTLDLQGRPTLVAQPPVASSFGEISASPSGPPPSVARVVIDVPIGYTLDLSSPLGRDVGIAALSTVESTEESISLVSLREHWSQTILPAMQLIPERRPAIPSRTRRSGSSLARYSG
jgi:hypothetical protein